MRLRLRGPSAIRWRLTLWYAAALAVTLVLFAGVSLVVLHRVLVVRGDHYLDAARTLYTAELAVELAELGNLEKATIATARETGFRDIHVCVFDDAARPVSCGDSARLAMPARVAAAVRALAAASREAGDTTTRAITAPDEEVGHRIIGGPVVIAGRRVIVVAAQARHALRETLDEVALAYLLAIPIALLAATLGGIVLARRALAPAAEMAARARIISAANLDARLAVADPADELGQLAVVVNDLLGRLEASFALQRRFVADASHELRTPVATICTEVDVALSRTSRSEAEYRDALRVVGDAGRRLARLVNDLFLLARADAGHLPIHVAPAYLDEIVADVARALRAQAAARAVRIEHDDTEAPIAGDAVLLERMMSNLVENAVRHSPAGGVVRVHLAMAQDTGGDAWILDVEDEGEGVPSGLRERIFERFFRADASRARSGVRDDGAGLGLAIARTIATAHGGSLACIDRESAPGARFRVRLPAHARPADAATPHDDGIQVRVRSGR